MDLVPICIKNFSLYTSPANTVPQKLTLLELIEAKYVGDGTIKNNEENKMSKINNLKFLSILFLMAVLFTAAACSTIDGAGKDIESVGEAIQE